jgi:hypothetical protein
MNSPDSATDGLDVVEQLRRYLSQGEQLAGAPQSRQSASAGPVAAFGALGTNAQTLPDPDGSTRRLWLFGHDPYPTDDSFYFGAEPLDSELEEI